MNTTWRIWTVLAGVMISFGSMAATFTIDADRMAVVEGKRTFILGLYENPSDDAVLKDAAGAGINLVFAGGRPEIAALDRLQAQGLFAWVNTGADIDWSTDREAREKGLKAMVDTFAGHPALLVWEVPDEALWNNWYSAQGWRGEEPGQLRKRLAEWPDKALADTLMKRIDEAVKLRGVGSFEKSEALMDSVWTDLGEKQPHPECSISTAQKRSEVMAEGMLAGYRQLRQWDPKHPVWMNHAPRNSIAQLAMFDTAADIVGCDIYPVPRTRHVGHSDLQEQTLAAVGAYTDRMQEAAPGKPTWMVLQGFGWADIQENLSPELKKELRRPTKEETRFMAYDAIVHGSRGILYWGTMAIEKDSACWKELLEVVAELSALQPVLAAPDSAVQPKVDLAAGWGSLDRGVRVLAKGDAARPALIVVNESTDPQAYTLSGLQVADGVVYTDTISGVEMTLQKGKLVGYIASQSVQVLQAK